MESHVQEKPSEFLRYLAARSRGISGVAWAIWRHSLQIAADHDTEENVQEKASQDSGITVWVTAWEDLALPELPGGLSSEGAFVLHSLLLHNRVRTEILPRLLPCSAAATMQAVKHLQTAGIVEEKDQTWQVTPLAYATVRNYLRSEGYLIDDH
jgi:negative regulator of replication initiation